MAEEMLAVLTPWTCGHLHDVPAGLPPVQVGAVMTLGASLQTGGAPTAIVPKSKFTVPRIGSLTFTPFPSRIWFPVLVTQIWYTTQVLSLTVTFSTNGPSATPSQATPPPLPSSFATVLAMLTEQGKVQLLWQPSVSMLLPSTHPSLPLTTPSPQKVQPGDPQVPVRHSPWDEGALAGKALPSHFSHSSLMMLSPQIGRQSTLAVSWQTEPG